MVKVVQRISGLRFGAWGVGQGHHAARSFGLVASDKAKTSLWHIGIGIR
jgi:hypothetical protein